MSAEQPGAARDRKTASAGSSDELTDRTPFESLLLDETDLGPSHIRRARRIAERLREPKTISEILLELGQLSRAEHERLTQLYKSRLEVPEILLEEGALDEAGLRTYQEGKRADKTRSDRDLLVAGGLVSEERYLQALSTKHNLPFGEPEVALIEEELLGKVSLPYLKRRNVLPFRLEDGVLVAYMSDPLDVDTLHELERIYEAQVQPWCATADTIANALERAVNRMQGIVAKDEDVKTLKYREIRDIQEGEEIGAEAVRIVDYVLYKAIEMGASDVHIEPRAKEVHVRVRVDGVLQSLTDLPGTFAPRIAARVKVLCGVDLAERRRHQDGRIFVRVDGREVDMRVSTYASIFGETVVIRLLDRARGLMSLDRLGFEQGTLRIVQDVVLRAPTGLVLVTGPTGSGKTTTLYSFVDSLLDGKLKVITAEDPVEYVLDGATQCSTNEKTGPSFADSLRAMVRQDPDVIVVGEVRDQITASLAVESALTGHKVLTSFHTEDSVGAIVRLLEMGVEPFLVASTVSCVIAQRLIRRLCPECSKEAKPSKKDLRYLCIPKEDVRELPAREPVGCEACSGFGFKGRQGIHEVLIPDDDFRDAILRRASSKELRALAKELPGFLSLQEDGLLKAVRGQTGLGELADSAPRDVTARPLAALTEIASRRSIA